MATQIVPFRSPYLYRITPRDHEDEIYFISVFESSFKVVSSTKKREIRM
jgi:hypothetical protein